MGGITASYSAATRGTTCANWPNCYIYIYIYIYIYMVHYTIATEPAVATSTSIRLFVEILLRPADRYFELYEVHSLPFFMKELGGL